MEAIEPLKCSLCQKSFSYRRSLIKHVKLFHPDKATTIIKEKTYKFTCDTCKKHFNNKKDFNYHKKKHNSNNTFKKTAIKKCPLCEYFNTEVHLCNHLKDIHEIIVKSSRMSFSSLEEFQVWKDTIEKETQSYFVIESTSVTQNYTRKKYHCHRSGNFISESKGMRRLKSQGSNKINGYCPSYIIAVMYNKGNCDIIFQETHVGHECDLGHLSLKKNEKETIAAKMSLEIPFNQILNDVQDSLYNSQLERIHLLTRKDLYNIKKSFNLQSTVVQHQNDAISISSWVTQMENSGCILFYKPQDTLSKIHQQLKNEDFVLIIMNSEQEEILRKYGSGTICLDGTHDLNQNNFELHTLMVLDNMSEGFPCAFCISNRSDEEVMSIFFKCVRERVENEIHCKVFMSDMAKSYHNAWLKIMGPAQFRLFCTWHVDQAWRENLQKIDSKEKQVMVYKYLRDLLQERDILAFYQMLEYFLKTELSEETDFATYFEENYANCCESWAYCFRKHCGINTNMHIERMHRTLNYIYSNGQKVNRLDKAIHEILKFVHNTLFSRIVTLNKGEVCSKLKELRKRHNLSLTMDMPTIIKNGSVWEIPSSTVNNYEVYTIEEIQSSCVCKITCTECDACLHKYICTCMDSSIKWNMCKHIHLLCMYLKRNSREEQSSEMQQSLSDDVCSLQFNENPSALEAMKIIDTLSKPTHENEIDLTKIKENLKTKLIGIVDSITCLEQAEMFEKLIAPIHPTLSAITAKTFNNDI